MTVTVIAFAVWAFLAALFLLLTMGKESVYPWSGMSQFGDTSLGRNSVNWLGTLALAGALLICWFIG